MENNNRGSVWRKWDLHVHTPSSIYQRFGQDDDETWEKYISDLESLPEHFGVIGINDYLFISGLDRLQNEKKRGRLKNINLLPVVEFRIDKFAGVQFGPLKRINLHVIFSEEITIETIQSQFLNTLEQSYTLDSGGSWTRAITPQSVEELGKNIKSQIPENELEKYGSDLVEGFNNLNINESAIYSALKKDCFKDKYLIAIGKTEWGDLKWSDASIATKKSIINSSHIVFTAAESIEAFKKAKDQLTLQMVNNLLLDCSDAHYLSNSNDKDRIGNCNTWIKASPNFEGLRQILFEPEQRIKVQLTEPDFKDDKLVIDHICFNSPDNLFPSFPIKLNKNLNVIIGGKSSGKSILLYNIARTLLADRSNNGPLKFLDTDINEFKYLYEFSNDPTLFDFKVKLKSGAEQSIHRGDNDPSILADIKYIPQNHLSNLVDRSRKEGNSLKKLIRGLILEESSSNLAYKNFVDTLKLNDSKRNNLIDDYFQILDKLTKLKGELLLKGHDEDLKNNILKNQQRIKELNQGSGFSDGDILKYENYTLEFNALKIQSGKIINDYQKLKVFHDEINSVLIELEQKKNQLLLNLEVNEIRIEFSDKLKFITDALSNANKNSGLFLLNDQRQIVVDSSIKSSLITCNERQNELIKLLEPFKLSEESKVQVGILENSIQEDQQKLTEIQQLQKEIEIYQAALSGKHEAIFQSYLDNFIEYEKIIELLDPRIKSIEGEDDKLEIKGIVRFNFPKFKGVLSDLTNLRSSSVDNLPLFQVSKSALSDFDFQKIVDQIFDLFNKIIDGTHQLKRTNKQEACKLILKDFFFDHWEVTSEGDTIHNMSTGKASFVLLKLIIKLSTSKAPILIDQPEDNLDNRSVTRDIVSYLRQKKLERQIILVTHNPNIVVNADAENIIIANQKGQNDNDSTSPYKFDYINGALEDSFVKNINEKDILKSMGIRQHIAEIVEGGEDAFKRRELKYSFPN
ncbi:TrlF family AAA-like ATPase [Sphingobacterium sp. BIGb0116]|uniref:TrlF family AAA-like ATPase n=1 Tax=Sphingobacterium sp. BIGb0116 TaxID=2940619 RepID=UPI002169E1D9|nr:hypothetical protein [Sphingobacterium sp. BIGb0116]MCS4164767.1 ABC-type cobalamin/Fe3+-siderophores transport system ATPase subunit [Sphingobacterium sp. BIGb0116]